MLGRYLARRMEAVRRVLESDGGRNGDSPGMTLLNGEYRAIIRALEYYH